jgi:Flp pilus assembly CpaF family ATPase
MQARVVASLGQARREAEAAGRRPLAGADEEAFAAHLISQALEAHATASLGRGEPVLSVEQERATAAAVHAALYKGGRLQALLDDPRPVINIIINGHERVHLELVDGTRVEMPPVADSPEELDDMVRELGRRYGFSVRQFDFAHPEINLHLPGGHRLHAVGWLCRETHITIARAHVGKLDWHDLIGMGLVDRGMGELLAAAVCAGLNICIAGGQGVGKTTTIRGLASAIERSTRIVTLETDYELALDAFPEQHDNVVALEARPPNAEGKGAVTLAELVPKSQRMRAERLIVGEVREHEIVPMLNAMNSGSPGMFSVHASSAESVPHKLALLGMQTDAHLTFEATNRLVGGALDLILYLGPRPNEKGGRAEALLEVLGGDDKGVRTNVIYRPGPDGRAVPDASANVTTLERLEAAGFDRSLLNRRQGWWS